jgi:hypothetical protein
MRIPGLILVVAAGLWTGCARPGELVVLLPDPDTGEVGGAVVTGGDGSSVELTRAREATAISGTGVPGAPALMEPVEIERIFGPALAALPLPVVGFTLYFELGGAELTPESREALEEVVAELQRRPNPELTVIGHTDRTGDPAQNLVLGLTRAAAVRDLLVAAGADPALVELESFGETDPLIPTGPGVAEPRNRRVEITVR